MKEINWKEQAQLNADAAGTLKIKIALRRDDVLTRIIELSKQLADTEDQNISICLMNRISMLEEEKKWLTEVLSGREHNNKKTV